jgi:hypothetical protein
MDIYMGIPKGMGITKDMDMEKATEWTYGQEQT